MLRIGLRGVHVQLAGLGAGLAAGRRVHARLPSAMQPEDGCFTRRSARLPSVLQLGEAHLRGTRARIRLVVVEGGVGVRADDGRLRGAALPAFYARVRTRAKQAVLHGLVLAGSAEAVVATGAHDALVEVVSLTDLGLLVLVAPVQRLAVERTGGKRRVVRWSLLMLLPFQNTLLGFVVSYVLHDGEQRVRHVRCDTDERTLRRR